MFRVIPHERKSVHETFSAAIKLLKVAVMVILFLVVTIAAVAHKLSTLQLTSTIGAKNLFVVSSLVRNLFY